MKKGIGEEEGGGEGGGEKRRKKEKKIPATGMKSLCKLSNILSKSFDAASAAPWLLAAADFINSLGLVMRASIEELGLLFSVCMIAFILGSFILISGVLRGAGPPLFTGPWNELKLN